MKSSAYWVPPGLESRLAALAGGCGLSRAEAANLLLEPEPLARVAEIRNALHQAMPEVRDQPSPLSVT